MSASLAANPNPTLFDAGPLGRIYIDGAVTGLAMAQDNFPNGDARGIIDLDNAQVFINKTYGAVQYYVQGGGYSIPDLGFGYIRSDYASGDFYGNLPIGFIKLAPTGPFSLEVGKLPTLFGAEYTWSFENLNVERGLLWNQEPAVSRGAQLNYANGPISAAVSWNDGVYSNVYTWIDGEITDTLTKTDTLELVAGENTQHSDVSTFVTPGALNDEQIYNVIYTHTQGPWTINPYFQYTSVPSVGSLGIMHGASTTGGALLLNYAVPTKAKFGTWNLPFRVEYISSTGTAAEGAPDLLYGPGSNAWSFTITPTYQYKLFFARIEASYVSLSSTTSGEALGPSGEDKSQSRALLETGVLF